MISAIPVKTFSAQFYRRITLLFFLVFFSTALFPALSFAQSGTAILLPFSDASGKRLGPTADDMLTARLASESIFTLVDSTATAAAVKKANYNASTADINTALETGHITKADYIIIGRIDSASMDKNTVVFAQQYEAKVRLNIKIISSFTGQVVYSANADGIDQNIKINGLGGKADYTNAVEDALDKIMLQLNRSYPVYAKIAAVNDKEVYINIGSQSGIKTGDIFTIYETGAAVIDPDTGKTITYQRKKIGTLKIIRVEGNASVGQLQNDAQPQIGQIVIKE